MRHDSDVILIGTGVAPLVAAARLMAEGRSVLVLNPDSDFFLEDSEFPVDRLQPLSSDSIPSAERFRRSTHERSLEILRPDFPGAVELWLPDVDPSRPPVSGYRDPSAPHVRGRMRLWMARKDDRVESERLNQVEQAAIEAGLHPRRLDGLLAVSRFPGHALSTFGGAGASPGVGFSPDDWAGLVVPRVADVDVHRYRSGLLTFVRERLGIDRVFTGVSDIDFLPDRALRFHAGGQARTARYESGFIVFWTPRLMHWLQTQAKRRNWNLPQPRGLRLWEQWSLLSRFPVDPTVIGVLDDMLAWADVEGVPAVPGDEGLNPKMLQRETSRMDEDRGLSETLRTRLTILRPAALSDVSADWTIRTQAVEGSRAGWISSESFAALERLCRGFLGWTRFSIRGLKTRTTLEWTGRPPVLPAPGMQGGWIVAGVEGPLPKVVETVRRCVDRLLEPPASIEAEETP